MYGSTLSPTKTLGLPRRTSESHSYVSVANLSASSLSSLITEFDSGFNAGMRTGKSWVMPGVEVYAVGKWASNGSGSGAVIAS